MRISQDNVAEQLASYLRHETTLGQLVDWAERALMEGDFEAEDMPSARDVVARLGLADVRAFGLTWDDCQALLSRLGYTARVEISAAK